MFREGRIPTITFEQLVINQINKLSNYEYWCFGNEFIKFLDIARLLDKEQPVSVRQCECLKGFLDIENPLVYEKFKEVKVYGKQDK